MDEATKNNRYRISDGKSWIEVRVKVAQQLFDVRDPAPFHDRDLDDDFVDYILASAREFSRAIPFKIVIYIESGETRELPKQAIREAIHNFFEFQAEHQRLALKTFLRRAQVFLIIGLVMLGTCLSLSQALGSSLSGPLTGYGILREGLLIFGWVSIWRPIELILYDWYPLYEKLRFYRKISASEIDVQFPKVTPVTQSVS
ncbi:MAG: hypothetical protein H7061_01965 [Bdellovibrionaceae bacterium]|nr:hypothetical protein [Bdellovibrio sp.]